MDKIKEQFEYKVWVFVQRNYDEPSEALEEGLNALGSDGWELFHVQEFGEGTINDRTKYIFKRKKVN